MATKRKSRKSKATRAASSGRSLAKIINGRVVTERGYFYAVKGNGTVIKFKPNRRGALKGHRSPSHKKGTMKCHSR